MQAIAAHIAHAANHGVDAKYTSPAVSAYRARYLSELARHRDAKQIVRELILDAHKCTRDPVILDSAEYYAAIVDLAPARVTRKSVGDVLELMACGVKVRISRKYERDIHVRKRDYWEHLFALLTRYCFPVVMYMGGIPDDIFDFVGVTHECFANPLSRYGGRRRVTYTSAYPDVDSYFGSLGRCTIENLIAIANAGPANFEMNPPYIEAFVFAAITIAHEVADAVRDTPVSFFAPNWPDLAKYGPQLTLKGMCARYRGSQSFVTEQPVQYFDNLVLFVQNELGKKRWPITPTFLADLKALWKC